MATGRILLPVEAWNPSEAGNGNMALKEYVDVGLAPLTGKIGRFLFKDGEKNAISTTLMVPGNFSSGFTLKIHMTTDQTTGNTVVWNTFVVKTSDDTEFAYGVAQTTDFNIIDSTTAHGITTGSDAIGDDGAAAGDYLLISLMRHGSHANDDLVGTAYFLGAIFEYTTT